MFHDLRPTFATTALQNDVDVKKVFPFWDTTTPGLPCAPTPTPPGRNRTRPPRPWAVSWSRSCKAKRRTPDGDANPRPAFFYPNASPAQRVAFGNGGTVKGASFARQGEASDLELVPTWVTVWVNHLTHILTRA